MKRFVTIGELLIIGSILGVAILCIFLLLPLRSTTLTRNRDRIASTLFIQKHLESCMKERVCTLSRTLTSTPQPLCINDHYCDGVVISFTDEQHSFILPRDPLEKNRQLTGFTMSQLKSSFRIHAPYAEDGMIIQAN